VSALHLKTLEISGWRNYTGEKIVFSPGINLFLGLNGQGKTNLLEAIFFLSCGQSPRTGKIDELINWKGNYFFLRGEICREQQKALVEMGGARDGRRVTKINGTPVQRLAQVSDLINSVFFMPDDLYLVKGGPARRRRFLDLEIGQISSSYRYFVGNYNKFLRERNALLKSSAQDPVVLRVLTEKLAELTGPITEMRNNYLQKLSILARLKHRKLSGSKEEMGLVYSWSIAPGLTSEEVLAEFAKTRALELKYRATMVGPHKDDFTFIVNGSDLRTFGSQGQQRTAVLALKLAEIDLFKAETGAYPLLLLDDVLSELDEQRKNMLLEYLSGKIQTFISSAEPLPPQAKAQVFWIEAGSIQERN
jgi:DNA replication and repair protein RecF